MMTVAIRDLRNNTAQVIQRARDGQTVVLTSRGEHIARIVPVQGNRRPFLTPADVLGVPQADAGLRDDLRSLGDDDTDDLGTIQ